MFGDEILSEIKLNSAGQSDFRDEFRNEAKESANRFEILFSAVNAQVAMRPGDSTVAINLLEAQLDAEIDNYRDLNNEGKTQTAMPLLERLAKRVGASASGRIMFRIKANIGHCLLALSRDEEAASMLLEAYEHAPEEPKAIANKAFGLLLRGDWKAVIEFGRYQLQQDSSNEWLAGYMIQAAKLDTDIEHPQILIPSVLHRTAAVQLSMVDFERSRGVPGSWIAVARSALVEYPNEPQAIQFAAEAEIEAVINSAAYQKTRIMSRRQREDLDAATGILVELLETKWKFDGPARPEDAALCGNVIVALSALDKLGEAIRIAKRGLDFSPEDVELITRAAHAAMKADDEEFASKLMQKLPASKDSVVLKFHYYAKNGRWSDVIDIADRHATLIPEVEKSIILTSAKIAQLRAEIMDVDERRMAIKDIATEVSNDPRASIIVANFARSESMEDVSEKAFKDAISRIGQDSHAADRFMVAQHADRRGDASVVADLLDGHVPEDHDNEELRMLVRAFVDDTPIRKRAISFFHRLPQTVRSLPYFLYAEGLMHFNRGALADAETALLRAVELDPKLDNLLALTNVFIRQDREDKVKLIVDSTDLETLNGTSSQKLSWAQIMRRVGRGREAINFAYPVLQSAGKDQDVALRYFGLVMADPEESLIPPMDVIAIDAWVRFKREFGDDYTFMIGGPGERSSCDVLRPSNALVQACLGLRVGDSFDVAVGFGEIRHWQVAEIEHKYLHALHDVMANFENRFPDSHAIHTFSMRDDDVEPALEIIRRSGERSKRIADLYLTHNCPISFLSSQNGRGSIGFVDQIRSFGFTLRTCLGIEPERLIANGILKNHRMLGAVLDTYTAWTVSTLDAFDVVLSVFGKVIIPRSVIDEIRALRDEQSGVGRVAMSISWRDGQLFRQEHTLQDIADRRDFIAQQVLRMEEFCEVKPNIYDDDMSQIVTNVSRFFGSHVLDPINAARDEHILVSEDLYYRQFGEQACATKGLWLQCIFSFALESGLIDNQRYAALIVGLAWRRHGHLRLNADTMLDVIRNSSNGGLEDFSAVLDFIGTKDADLFSHLRVSIEFLNRLWIEFGMSDLRCSAATSVVLNRILRYREDQYPIILAWMKRNCVPVVRQYIDGWVVGHFLSPQAVEDAASGVWQRGGGSVGGEVVNSKRKTRRMSGKKHT